MKALFFYIQKRLEIILRKLPSCGQVLMFHQVRDNIDESYDEPHCISIKSFKNLIEELEKKNRKFYSIENILKKNNSRQTYITFDDGYEDIYTNAYPVLKQKNIPFCIFITIELIDKKGYLTMEMLKVLANDPLCTVGSHTISHPLLRYSNSRKCKFSSLDEIKKSKLYLEENLGKNIDIFAYPYGSFYACSLKNILEVKKSKYKLAFSTIDSNLNKFSLYIKYFIPRVNVNENTMRKIIR